MTTREQRVDAAARRMARNGARIEGPIIAQSLGAPPESVRAMLMTLGYRPQGFGRGMYWLLPEEHVAEGER